MLVGRINTPGTSNGNAAAKLHAQVSFFHVVNLTTNDEGAGNNCKRNDKLKIYQTLVNKYSLF